MYWTTATTLPGRADSTRVTSSSCGRTYSAAESSPLDTRVLDAKIAERARGLMEDRAPDAIEDIARHVSGVLRPTPVHQTISLLLEQLREEFEARKLTSKAKTLLQSSCGMSEEAAHRYLQKANRESRRPLREIAEALVEEFSFPAPRPRGSSHGPA